ncbi:ArdC-like ssDNA-binding domain-containing protein [Caulifigura coniformis]|uniref:ArdC-like ssDNA-binding domain-containing protein n=1 Tax=Caulifigura coniformis TaxID=2527983 RepID=UPI0011A0DC1A
MPPALASGSLSQSLVVQIIYTRITNQIVVTREWGCRPWFQPWQVKHTAGSVTRPLQHNGERYQGVNVLSL